MTGTGGKDGATTPATTPSLATRLVRRVLLPLALTWGVGSVVVLAVGKHFTTQAFDRALLDDAYAISAHVRPQPGGRLVLDLTPQETSTLLFDHSETLYFAVYAADGSLLAGRQGLPAAPIASIASIPRDTPYQFSEFALEGERLRSVTVKGPGEQYVVVLAQTTASRTALLQRLLIYSSAVQLWLLLLLAFWLRRVIAQDLRPLAHLQQALDRRDAADLAPLPPELTQAAPTREVGRLGEAVNSLLARLERSLGAQREFAGNVAHELRTPLAAIRMHANHALAQDDTASWSSEMRAVAQAESRASRLVDQLLALARADEVGAALAREPVALDELVRDVVLRFVPRADDLGVDLGAEGLDDGVQVLGDLALIEGILNNLVDNALRYGRGADQPRVTVALQREGDTWALSVSDNGPGLGDEPALQLTQRWTQGRHGERLGEGAGLGLAIVRRYAGLLGAVFTLEPAPGGGLCARLRFAAPHESVPPCAGAP